MPGEDRTDLSYPDFMERVKNGEITKIRVNNDSSKITGALSDGKLFSSTAPRTIPTTTCSS